MFKYTILFFIITGIYFASVQHLFMPMERDPFLKISKQLEEADKDIINYLTKVQQKYYIKKEKERKLALQKKEKEDKRKEENRKRREAYAQKIIAQKLKKIAQMRKEALARLEAILLAREKKLRDNAIIAKIDLSEQRMRVYKGNNLIYKWKVSTARRGYKTPKGKYTPQYMQRMHYSKEYHNSPMPYSIFFRAGGYAIHGTKSVHRLGRPASHGCVRLHTKNAKSLFKLIQKSGKDNTIIHITN